MIVVDGEKCITKVCRLEGESLSLLEVALYIIMVGMDENKWIDNKDRIKCGCVRHHSDSRVEEKCELFPIHVGLAE